MVIWVLLLVDPQLYFVHVIGIDDVSGDVETIATGALLLVALVCYYSNERIVVMNINIHVLITYAILE